MTQLPDIRQLRIFIALEKTRSFTAAAGTLRITQSAVSHSMKSLESLLECQLIERLGKKCILTPYGEVFLHHAKQAVQHLEGAASKIKTLNSWGYSSLKIGVTHAQSQYVLPEALCEFYDKEKRCEVFVVTGDTPHLLEKIDKGVLDVVFGIKRSRLENEFQFREVAKDDLCFITHPDHPWVTKKPENSEDYEKERFIIYGNESLTTGILDTHLSGLGIKYRTSISINNMESIKAMVATKLGVGIVSDWTIRKEVEKGTLVKHPIQPAPVREWGYYLGRTKSLSSVEGKFIDIFSEKLQSMISGV